MREITPESFRVYNFDELDSEVQQNAVWNVRHLMTGAWWDNGDVESIGEEILFGLAEALHSPGWDKYGPGDFPGIDGVELVSWDLGRSDSVGLDGTLTQLNAPALPWHETIGEVYLAADRGTGHTLVGVACEDPTDEQAGREMRGLQDAVFAAIEKAKKAGRAQEDYLTGEERAREDIENNGREFYEDGRLYQG